MKFIKSVIALLSIMGSLSPLNIQAEASFGDFPYEGTYLTEEDNYLHGYHFDHDNETITILTQDSANNIQRVLDIRNNYNPALWVSPSIKNEEVIEVREGWGLDSIDFDQIFQEAANQVEPWMTKNDVLKLIHSQTTGLYVYDYGYSRRFAEIMIVKPEIKPSQDLWIVGLIGNPRVLRFEMGDDLDTLVDDFGVTYHKQEVDNNEEIN